MHRCYLLLILLFVAPAFATEPLIVESVRNGGGTIYSPQNRYIHQSGVPFVAQNGDTWWPLGESVQGLGFNGALKYDGKTWTVYTAGDGLFDGRVQAVVQSPDGALWFTGSHKGKAAVARFDGKTWQILTDGLVGKTIGPAALIDRKGRVWLATEHTDLEAAGRDSSKGGDGILCYDGKTWTHLTVADGLAHNRVYDIAEDRDGTLWFATYHGLSHYDPTARAWTTYTQKDGLGDDKIYGVLCTHEGLIWCTHGGKGGVSIYNRRTWRHITQADGMPVSAVREMVQTRDGALWFGTNPDDGATGLIRFQRGNWLRFLKKDGLPDDGVYAIAENTDGSLWLLAIQNKPVRFQPDLSKLQTVSDVLHDEKGDVLAGVGVHLTGGDGQFRAGTVTDLNGNYRLPMFNEPYNLVVEQPQAADPELARRLSGIWQGTLKVSGIQLRLVFHLTADSTGTLTATMDSPDQGVTGLPTNGVDIFQQNLTIAVNRIRGAYEGQINAPDNPTRIDGFWKQAGQAWPVALDKVDAVPEIHRPQEPKPPYPYRTEDVAFKNADAGITLAGTLTRPETGGPFPAVVLVSGSGPQNRDEEILGHKPFLVLADHLTRKGIAVLRVDDRGVGKSTGEFGKATTEDLASDALSGVRFLKTRSDIRADKIGLIGHSEGGLIAPMIAVESPDVAFIVLLAGPGLPGDRILALQQKRILKAAGASDALIAHTTRFITGACDILKREPNNAEAERDIRALNKRFDGEMDDAMRTELKKLGNPDPDARVNALLPTLLSPWMRYFIVHDPAETLQKVTCPTLALIGTKDLQVPPEENLPALRAALKNDPRAVVKELPGLNHLFQTAETGSPSEYARIEETFSPLALNTISDWIAQQEKDKKE